MARKAAFALSASAAMLAGGLGLAAPASAYGNTAVYQIELSANISGHAGGGVWLWIELDSNGTGDYNGSDCGHAGQGAAADSGGVSWSDNGGTLTITGVTLNGLGGFPTVITVPATSYEPSSVMSSGWISMVSVYLSVPASTRLSTWARIPSLYSEALMNATLSSWV